MVHTPAQILQQLLITGSSALFSNPAGSAQWPLYFSSMPDGTDVMDNVGAVYDIDGVQIARLLASGENIESYGIQIKSRCMDASLGYTILYNASLQMEKVKRQVINVPVTGGPSVQYTVDTISKTSQVISMGQDQRRRAFYSLDVLLMLLGQ